MQWCDRGLICAPWLAPERASSASARCPLPLSPIPPPPTIPDTTARLVGGWYRRSELHAPAPAGIRELVQATGEGFGAHDHPTTALCLTAMSVLPPGDALDVGCGSGLLGQAWIASGKGAVHAVDANPAAVIQTRRSLQHLSTPHLWRATVRRIEQLTPDELADAVVLANLPAVAQAALLAQMHVPPRAVLVSGTDRGQTAPFLAGLRHLGLRVVHLSRAGRYLCVAALAR